MAAYEATLVTHPGFEDIAALEANELIGAKATTAKAGIVEFQVLNPLDLCKLCYLSQSASQVLLQGLQVNPFDLGTREHAVFGKSGDLPGNVAYLLLRAAGYDGKKSLFDPFTRSGAIAIEAAIFSSGFPVNYYRKDSLASAFSRRKPFSKSDFSGSQVAAATGPNRKSGYARLRSRLNADLRLLPIWVFAAVEKEASAAAKKRAKSGRPKILSSSQSMQNVRFAEKNAKIAGVNKLIRFSRLDIEWLDAKLAEHSIDLVVSYPPQFKSGSGKDSFAAAENNKLQKMYKDFFYQADFFLKNSGEVVLLLKESWNNVAAAASNYKFTPKVLRKFGLGGYELELVSFSR